MAIEHHLDIPVGNLTLRAGYDAEAHRVVITVPLPHEQREPMLDISQRAIAGMGINYLNLAIVQQGKFYWSLTPPDAGNNPAVSEMHIQLQLEPDFHAGEVIDFYRQNVAKAIDAYRGEHPEWQLLDNALVKPAPRAELKPIPLDELQAGAPPSVHQLKVEPRQAYTLPPTPKGVMRVGAHDLRRGVIAWADYPNASAAQTEPPAAADALMLLPSREPSTVIGNEPPVVIRGGPVAAAPEGPLVVRLSKDVYATAIYDEPTHRLTIPMPSNAPDLQKLVSRTLNAMEFGQIRGDPAEKVEEDDRPAYIPERADAKGEVKAFHIMPPLNETPQAFMDRFRGDLAMQMLGELDDAPTLPKPVSTSVTAAFGPALNAREIFLRMHDIIRGRLAAVMPDSVQLHAETLNMMSAIFARMGTYNPQEPTEERQRRFAGSIDNAYFHRGHFPVDTERWDPQKNEYYVAPPIQTLVNSDDVRANLSIVLEPVLGLMYDEVCRRPQPQRELAVLASTAATICYRGIPYDLAYAYAEQLHSGRRGSSPEGTGR